MSRRFKIQDATGGMADGPDPLYKLLSYSRGAPTNGQAGFENGCVNFDVTNGVVYYNSGTSASSTWLVLTGYATQPTPTVTELNLLSGLLATAAEINRTSKVSSRLVTVAAATTTLSMTLALHEGRTIVVGPTGGLIITPPAATGTGGLYRIVVGTTVSGGNLTIDFKAGNASDVFAGVAITNKSTSTYSGWNAASNTNLITLNGSTLGGVLGDIIELQDIATNQWIGRIIGQSSSTVATPFSNH